MIFVDKTSLNKLPSKNNLETKYKQFYPIFKEVLIAIEQKLKTVLSLPSSTTMKSRIKDFNSYYRKFLRIKPKVTENQCIPYLTDLMGIRIICAFLDDLSVVEHQIIQNFSVKEIERKGASLNFKEFGYESVHILIDIPEEILVKAKELGVDLSNGCVCEIQVRTILQDAWAEVEHELVYKSEFSPFDLPLKRKLASINASLSLADIIFQEIRDYQTKLNREIDFRRNNFYDKADLITHETMLPGEQTTQKPASCSSPYVRGTIDDMLLEAIHAHNAGDLDRAVEIYTRIIDSDPKPNNIILAVISKHRGMAYFAQNDYDLALKDFEDSVKFQPDNFRSLYYIGIVNSVKGDNEAAIQYYNKSLEINEFQSHVYYRRALAHFNLGMYTEAASDIANANKLGLDDEDCRRLKNEIMKHFDMNM